MFVFYFCQQAKSGFILKMNTVKSGIVFLFRPFLFVSWYHGKVPGSDLDVIFMSIDC